MTKTVQGRQFRTSPKSTANFGPTEFLNGKCDVSYVEEFYKDAFKDYVRLKLQRDILLDQAKEKEIELVDFESLLNVLKANVVLFPLIQELVKLVKIVLCMPVCNCTAERSFSSLRQLKTYV